MSWFVCVALPLVYYRDDPQLVVVMDSSSKLFVFNNTSSFMYTVTGVVDGFDITFGPDNLLWIAEQANDGGLVHFPELFLQLPTPLFHLCRLSILPHLNELPVSLLPPRLAGLVEKWTHLATR